MVGVNGSIEETKVDYYQLKTVDGNGGGCVRKLVGVWFLDQ